MKLRSVFSLTIVYVGLMHGNACAASFDSASQGASTQGSPSAGSDHSRGNAHGASDEGANQHMNGKPSGERDHNQASGAVHSRGKDTIATVPKQPIRDPKHATHGRSATVRQPDSSGSNAAQKGTSTQNQTVSKALPVRSPTVAPRVEPSHNSLGHRSPNPPVVGGPPNSKAVNTGAINGTHAGRRP
jgi:hypothetical protein